MDRAELERLDREGLVMRAQAAGIRRARLLTRPELIDELLRLDPAVDATQLRKTRGFFGIARDLLTRVVERGLHLPDAADRLRAALGNPLPHVPRPEPQAVPTVTLAEIYAAQGHKQRAIETLERVLEAEPEHGPARALVERLVAEGYVAPTLPLPPEPEDEIGAHLGTPSHSAAGLETRGAAQTGEEEAEPSTARTDGAPAPAGAAEAEEPEPSTTQFAPEPPEPSTTQFAPEPSEPSTTQFAPEPSEPSTTQFAPEPPEPSTTQFAPEPPEPSTVAVLRPWTECVAIPLDGSTMFVWWSLSTAASAQLGCAASEGGAGAREVAASFVVRVVILLPTWDGPVKETRDVACDPAAGELVLRDLPEGAVVRIAVGVLEGGELVPFAHSPALEAAPSRGLVQWTPEGAVPVVLETSPAIARAAEGAARAAARHTSE